MNRQRLLKHWNETAWYTSTSIKRWLLLHMLTRETVVVNSSSLSKIASSGTGRTVSKPESLFQETRSFYRTTRQTRWWCYQHWTRSDKANDGRWNAGHARRRRSTCFSRAFAYVVCASPDKKSFLSARAAVRFSEKMRLGIRRPAGSRVNVQLRFSIGLCWVDLSERKLF